MKKIIFIFLLALACYGQQTNYTWGYNASGTAWNQGGSANLDSNGTITIVLDMQDYYFDDWYPLEVNDIYTFSGSGSDSTGGDSSWTATGSTTATVYSNSTRLYYGTLWYMFDLENSSDSIMYTIKSYPGNMTYYGGTGGRITTSNITWSSTATTIVDTTAGTYTTGDIQWTPVNVYVGSVSKVLPSEFLKIVIDLEQLSCDSIDGYWNYGYRATNEGDQDNRRTTNTGNAKKAAESLH